MVMRNWVAIGVGLVFGFPALGQESAATAAELIEALKARGIEVPGVTVNEDGTVSLPAPADGEGGAPAPVAPPAPAPPPAPEPAVEWSSSLNIGLALSAGNSESANLAGEFETKRTTKRSELTIDAAYYYAEDGGDESENRLTAGVNHDWLLDPSRWLFFVGGRVDVDEFQDWEWRLNFNAGIGYKVIRRDDVNLTLRAGAGAFREFGGGDRELKPEVLLGADFDWAITGRQSFEASARIFPSLDDGGEFRARNTAGYKLLIDDDSSLSFTVSLIHEYQSEVEGDTEENDFKLFAGVAYDF